MAPCARVRTDHGLRRGTRVPSANAFCIRIGLQALLDLLVVLTTGGIPVGHHKQKARFVRIARLLRDRF